MINHTIYLFISIIFYVANVSIAQSPPQAAQGFEYVGSIWSPPGTLPATLRDVAGRLPINTDAKHEDLITYTHEGTHFLAMVKDGRHGIYVGNGLRIYLSIPNILTAELFRSIPLEERGVIYDTYRKQGENEYWVDKPTMVIDEWVAYTHGSMVRKESGVINRVESDKYCAILANYTWHLIELAKSRKIDVTDIILFSMWNNERCIATVDNWDSLFVKKFE